jgi:hypothetical protein
MKTDYTSLVFLLVGAFALWLEFFFPRAAAYNPMARWIPPYGPPAGRPARITGAIGCFLVALCLMDIVVGPLQGTLTALWIVAILCCAGYDLSRVSRTEDTVDAKPGRKPQPRDPRQAKTRRRP